MSAQNPALVESLMNAVRHEREGLNPLGSPSLPVPQETEFLMAKSLPFLAGALSPKDLEKLEERFVRKP